MTREDLEETIRKLKGRVEKAEIEQQGKELNRNIQLIKNQEFEKKHENEKSRIYENIQSWALKFVQTNTFKELIDLTDVVRIYGGGWGHAIPNGDGYGCWSYVTLNQEAVMWYQAGYKWMGISKGFAIDDLTIEDLNIEYVKDLHVSITSVRVYDYIRDDLKAQYKNPLYAKFMAKRKEIAKRRGK